MRRVVRKLIVPDQVTLVYRGMRATNTSTMTALAGNEFTGNFAELKETVSYTVRGEDYVTARRTITVVERPRVDSLESEEERPAYLYYRPAKDGSPDDIRLKRQPLEAPKLSVSSDTTTIEVPVGTYVTLDGMLSKPLYKIDFSVEPKDKKNFAGNKPEIVETTASACTLPNVRREQRFKLLFTDTDGVTGERKIVLIPRPDTTPRVARVQPRRGHPQGPRQRGLHHRGGLPHPVQGPRRRRLRPGPGPLRGPRDAGRLPQRAEAARPVRHRRAAAVRPGRDVPPGHGLPCGPDPRHRQRRQGGGRAGAVLRPARLRRRPRG